MKILSRNGEYIGEIVETHSKGGRVSNIRLGSLLSVFFPLFMIFIPWGWAPINIAGVVLLAISVAVGIAVKGAKEFFLDIIGGCFFFAGIALSFFVGSCVTKRSNFLFGLVVGVIVCNIVTNLVEKIFFKD